MVLLSETISSGKLTEPLQINDIQRRDMIWKPTKEVLPVTLFPEAESFHFSARVAHWCKSIRRITQVFVDKINHICAYDLICIDEDDFIKVQREEYVKEKNLVAPDFTLLLFLSTKPMRPLIRNHFVLETVFLSHCWYKRLKAW